MVHKSRNLYRLLLLGHACWAYVTGRLAAHGLGVRPNLYLLMLLGMLPDVDLLLGVFDIQHRTITHSIIFWSLLFVPCFIRYRQVAIPYFIAVTQHILLGDFIVGRTAIFWPLTDIILGLGLSVLSPVNLILEAIGLGLLLALVIRSQEPRRISPIFRILVAVPLAAFVVIASFGDFLPPIFLEGSDARYLERSLPGLLVNPAMQISVVLHLGLLAFIMSSFVPGSLRKMQPK